MIQDTLILRDTMDTLSVRGNAGGVDWLTAVLVSVVVLVIIGGIWILKRKDRRRTFPTPIASPLPPPPPPVEEKRRGHPRGKKES